VSSSLSLTQAQRRSQAHLLAASLPHALWRGDAMGSYRASGRPTGYAQLDKELPGGGWPPSALTELLWAQQGSGEIRLLVPVLRTLAAAGETIALLGMPHRLCAPALAQAGIDVRQLLLVQSEKTADRLWAAEQILKSASCGALLCWLPQVKPDHLRRLQLAAGNCEGIVFMFRHASVQAESSPAPLRLLCQARPGGQVAIDIIKRRGPAAAAPVMVAPPLPQVVMRAWQRKPVQRVPVTPSSFTMTTLSSESPHAVDRALSAAIAAGSRISSLA
jgi:protein ImuA